MSEENLNSEQIWDLAMSKAQTGGDEENPGVLTDDDFIEVGNESDEDISISDDNTESTSEDTETKTTQESTNKKTLKIKDEFGEERDLSIELTDANLQALVQKAKDAELIEQEKGSLMDELKSVRDQIAEMKATVEEAQALKSLSPEDIIDKLYAKDGGYSAWLKKQHDEIERGKEMTEEELREHKLNKERQLWEKEKKALADKVDNLMKQINEKSEKAEQSTLDSWVEAATTKYSFSGVFKDNEKKAAKWDRRVWREAQETLAGLQKQNVQLTPAIINREVRAAFLDVKADIEGEVDSTVDKKITEQKNKAAASATNNFKTAQETDVLEAQVRKLLETGNDSKIRQLISQAPGKMKAILEKIATKR